MSRSAGVYLWVRPEVFDIGIIPIPPPQKLTHHNLRKLFAYAKNKGKVGYPNLSYSVWKHVACNKLQIDEHLAWVYFHTCEVLIENKSELHLSNAQHITAAKNKAEEASIKEKRSIDLLKFILYLYIQHAHVISLKSPVVTGDEYPSRNRSQDLEGRAAIGTKGLDENAQTSFISTNITEILDLLVEPESYGDESDVMITLDAVRKLSFLIGATVDGRNILPLNEAACLQKEAQKSGFSKISSMFSCRRLQSWIKAYLRQNPFGICSCLSLGQKLRGRGYSCGDDSLNGSLSTSICDDQLSISSTTSRVTYEWLDIQAQLLKDSDLSASFKSSQSNLVNRIITNSNYAPECSKRIICNQVCRKTVARSGDTISNTTINIHRCQNSHLYLLSYMRAVVIEKCHNTTIVLGAVDTVVTVIACDNINLIGVTKRLVIISCRDSVFHICSQSRPVLIGRNKNIKLAPYYTFYPQLEYDMKYVGVSSQPNYWNQPILLGGKKDEEKDIWTEFPIDEFSKFVIPFEMEGDTTSCPMELPSKYEKSLLEREKRIQDWHDLVRSSELNKPQRTHLQSMVISRFQDWLKDSGYNTLLESLASSVPPSAPR